MKADLSRLWHRMALCFFGVNRTRAFTVLTKADEGRNGLCDWLKNDPCSWCAADSEGIKIKAQVGLKTKNFDRIVLRLISKQSSLVLLFTLEGGVNRLRLALWCSYSCFEMSLGPNVSQVCKPHSFTFLAVHSRQSAFESPVEKVKRTALIDLDQPSARLIKKFSQL